MTDHPITPSPALVEQWLEQSLTSRELAAKAFQAGADQELEACCEWVRSSLPGYDKHYADYLHIARRPKPPSLKEQALEALGDAVMRADCITISAALPIIRRALEALDD